MKNHENHDLRVSARTFRLTAGEDDDGPWRFGGVAVAAGDILHMDDGTPVLFTEEELRKAAETQAGEPLTVDHPSDDAGQPVYPPPTDETVGKVARAGWIESQRAVGYEATTHDETIAKGVQAGTYDVSVHPIFQLGEKDEATGAYIAKNIRFRDLSVVSKGDSPSNTAEWGPNQALASWTASNDFTAELTAADGDDDPTSTTSTETVIGRTVRATLNAVGIGPDAAEVQASDEGAESSTDTPDDPDEPGQTMDRDTIIKTLVDEHDFSEESLENMSDDDLERLEESLVESADNSGGQEQTQNQPQDGPSGQDAPQTLGEMSVDELGQTLRDQGFVTEDNAADVVASAQDQVSKAEKVQQLIAASDDYDEDDRESLMASADSLIEREHQRVVGTGGADLLPGNAGSLTAAAPGAGESTDDADAYGTGVQED